MVSLWHHHGQSNRTKRFLEEHKPPFFLLISNLYHGYRWHWAYNRSLIVILSNLSNTIATPISSFIKRRMTIAMPGETSQATRIVATEEDDVLSDILSDLRISPKRRTSSDAGQEQQPQPQPQQECISPVAFSVRENEIRRRDSRNSLSRSGSTGILKKTSSYNYLGDSTGQTSILSNSAASSTTRGSNKVASAVSFQSVNIREYDRIIGDNPSCKYGIPISLDWSHSGERSHTLNDYEKFKGMQRSKSMMRMNARTRESIVKMKLGYSDEEIAVVLKENKKIQRSRSMTDLVSPLWRVEAVCESAARKLKRRLGNKKTAPQNENDLAIQTFMKNSLDSSGGHDLDRSLGSSAGSFDETLQF